MGWNLVADIGGTNMRLAAGSNGRILAQETLPTVGDVTVAEALVDFISRQDGRPEKIAVAAAGIVHDGCVTLTNTGTLISEEGIRSATGVTGCHVLNDFEAAAWALADVNVDDVLAIQGGGKLVRGTRVIIGPGTGLGVGGLVFDRDRPVVVKGEGGHVRLSPDTPDELEIFRRVGEGWPQTRMGDGFAVEAEAVLSGTGLPHFYRAVAGFRKSAAGDLTAAGIFAAASGGNDPVATETVERFAKYLGELAGDMGTTFAATGGVFLVGGVLAANPWMFNSPVFIDAFNSGGRHTGFRQSLPVYLFRNPNFGLLGALNFLRYGS